MRKMLSIICALILIALLPVAPRLLRSLPVDTAPYVAEKYAGWNGVVQAWVCSAWEGGGSFITWLNRCAARFEKAHEGVYIEFTPVNAEAMAGLGQNGVRMPELVFFSPGVLAGDAPLEEVGFPDSLREELRLDGRALAVAMGGTIWAVNPAAGSEAILCSEENAAGLIGLLSGGDDQEAGDAPAPEAPGLDLGLPAFAQGGGVTFQEDALDLFLDGGAARIAVNAGELARLARLRDNGRGPEWTTEAAGEFACADQLLYAGVTSGEEAPRALAREFARSLLEEESQAELTSIGLFSVTGECIHAAHAAQAGLDIFLHSRPLAAAQPFSEHSAREAAGIVQRMLAGELAPREAAAKIGFGISLPKHPN